MKNYKTLVRREMAKYNIGAVTILEPNLWVGNYGLVVSHYGDWFRTSPKYVYRILRTLQNVHNCDKWENIDNHYYYMPSRNHKVIEHDRTTFIRLYNGQVFDVTNQYWFTVNESKLLLKELEKGYNYNDPVDFFDDHESVLGYRGSMAE